VARVLILGGGCRGRQLAAEIVGGDHAVRIVTRAETRRAAIEAAGAECFLGDPNRLGTLRGVLDGVTVACWLLATATGASEDLHELHVSRLPAFLGQAVDSTMRGFVYEAPSTTLGQFPSLAEGARLAQDLAARNAIEATAIVADPGDITSWLIQARAALSHYL
jgi:hypothetical protein